MGHAGWQHSRPVSRSAGHELAGGIGQQTRNAVRASQQRIQVILQGKVGKKLHQNLLAAARQQGFGDEVADAVNQQPVAPPHLNIRGLVGIGRRMKQMKRQAPVGVDEGDQAAPPCRAGAERRHVARKQVARVCHREGNPSGLLHMAAKCRRVAKGGIFGGQAFPERPGGVGLACERAWGRIHGPQAGISGHGAQGGDDQIVRAHFHPG